MMVILDKEISNSAPNPYIIAEIASSHEGNVERAKRIVNSAAEANADAVKFQIWRRDDYCTPDHPDYEVLGQLQFDPQQWHEILGYAKSTGMALLADIDSEACLDIALDCVVDGLKIRLSTFGNTDFLAKIASTGKPLFITCGGATLAEIDETISTLESNGASDIVLLHGFQAFPTLVEDTHLRTIGLLRQQFGKVVGCADPADGDSHLAFDLPIAALAAGACVIEKHITIDRELKTQDFESSLNPPEFEQLIKRLRKVWIALGRSKHEFTEAELAYRKRFKKFIVAKTDISSGEEITSDSLSYKACGKLGMLPSEATKIIGRRTVVHIQANTPLSMEMVE